MHNSPSADTMSISLSKAEIELVVNALNEVCNGLDIAEFSIRMGAEKPEVLRLLNRLAEILR